jgi:hypothetical protein
MVVVRVVKVGSPAASVIIKLTVTGSRSVVVAVEEEFSEFVVTVSGNVPGDIATDPAGTLVVIRVVRMALPAESVAVTVSVTVPDDVT